MDQVTFSSIFTVAVFVIFIAIVLWAYSKKSQAGFEEAANLVFDDEKPQHDAKREKQESSNNE